MRLHRLGQVGLVLIAFALGWPAAGELHPKFLFGHDAQPGEEMIILNDFSLRYMRAVFEAYETESFEDDEAVIRQMLVGVEQFYVVEDTGQRYYVAPDVQARAYRESIIMARASEGQELLATDLQLAAQRALPLHRWFQEDPPLDLYEAWYEQAEPADRQAHAHGYIGLLVDRSLAQERAGEIADAMATTRAARAVARDTDNDWAPILQAQERRLRVVDRELRRIGQYEQRVVSGEATAEVLHALALWRLLFNDDAEAALGFAQQANDETLQARLAASMQAIEGLEAAEALALAQWFTQLAENPAVQLEAAQAQALRRAVVYYRRFLEVHDKQDVTRLIADETLMGLHERIEAISPSAGSLAPERWTVITGQVLEPGPNDNGNLVIGTALRMRGDTVTLENSRMRIPVHVGCDYAIRMQVELKRAGPQSSVSLNFPIGDESEAHLFLGRGGPESGGMYGLGPIETLRGIEFRRNRPVALRLHVMTLAGGRARLMLWLDETQVLDWSGPVSLIDLLEQRAGGTTYYPAFQISSASGVEFSSIAVRPLRDVPAEAEPAQ